MKASYLNFHALCLTSLLTVSILAASPTAYAAGNFYQQHNLVADLAGVGEHTDSNLVNAWGVAFNPFGPVWVADNGTSTLYDGTGVPLTLVVQVPTPTSPSGGNPTGIVYNGSSGFVVSANNAFAASRFIESLIKGISKNCTEPVEAEWIIFRDPLKKEDRRPK